MKQMENRTGIKIAATVLFMIAAFLLCGMRVQAAQDGQAVEGEIKQLESDATAKADRDETSATVMLLKSGDYIYVTAEDDEWYEIYYQDRTLYVEKNPPAADIDYTAEITSEMEDLNDANLAWVEDYQAQLKAHRRTVVWRIIIAVLVVSFIAVSAVTIWQKKE